MYVYKDLVPSPQPLSSTVCLFHAYKPPPALSQDQCMDSSASPHVDEAQMLHLQQGGQQHLNILWSELLPELNMLSYQHQQVPYHTSVPPKDSKALTAALADRCVRYTKPDGGEPSQPQRRGFQSGLSPGPQLRAQAVQAQLHAEDHIDRESKRQMGSGAAVVFSQKAPNGPWNGSFLKKLDSLYPVLTVVLICLSLLLAVFKPGLGEQVNARYLKF